MTKNRRLVTVVALYLLACGTGMAQSKGQQASPPNGAQQNNVNAQANVPPPELYPLADLPMRRDQVLASMKGKKIKPRFIWYKTAPRLGGPASTAFPVVLVPMSCADRPVEWTNTGAFAKKVEKTDPRRTDANFDPGFARDCDRVAGDAAFASAMPSLPAQDRGPLKAGDGIVIGIYDKDQLLTKFAISMIGLTVQSATGSYITTAPVRPSASAGTAAPAPGVGANARANARADLPIPDPCGSVQIVGGNLQRQIVAKEFSAPLMLQVLQPDRKTVAGNAVVSFKRTVSGKVTPFEKTSDALGSISIAETAPDQAGSYRISASCKFPAKGSSAVPTIFELMAYATDSQFYYLPWWNNPVAGDVTLSVSVTAQAPTPTPLTVSTNPPGLTFNFDGLPFSTAKTLAFPIGKTVPVKTNREQAINGAQYQFLRWNNGGKIPQAADDPVEQDVTIGSTPMTLVAEFAPVMPTDAGGPDDSRVAVTLATSPPGMPVTITSGSCGRQNLIWRCPPGIFRVQAEPTQYVGGHMYYFRSWSDGEGPIHDVQVDAEPITLIANYSEASPPPAGATAPVSIRTNAGLPGLAVAINGVEYISPQTLSYPAATPLDLRVPTPQNLDGYLYTFSTWQDGVPGPARTVPAASSVELLFPVIFSPRPPMPVLVPATPLILSTDPPGLAVTIRDTASADPAVTYLPSRPLSAPFGSAAARIEVIAVSPQYNNNAMYTFQSWEDPAATGPRRQIDIPAAPGVPKPIKAIFSATPIVSAIPVTVATNPPGLRFSVNGIARTSSTVAFLPAGSTAALSTDSPQSLGGVQYTFQGWSDTGTNNTSLAHTFSVPGGPTLNQGNTQGNANPNTQQTQNNAASSASVTAVFAPSAPAYTEQTPTLLSTFYPQTHNPSYFNISSGIIASTLRNPTWTRQETAPGVTCAAGAPQPCVASPALYQTVQNPPGARTIDPVLFLVIYIKPFDGERKWRWSDLTPAPSLGMSLTSPSTDFFLGVSSEVRRNVQIVAGSHIGKINELSPTGVNDPTSSTAPALTQHFHPGWFIGATFNISNFIQTLFSPAKGAN